MDALDLSHPLDWLREYLLDATPLFAAATRLREKLKAGRRHYCATGTSKSLSEAQNDVDPIEEFEDDGLKPAL